MRIVFFLNGGEFGLRPLRFLAERHDIALVVRPRPVESLARRAARAVKHFITQPSPDVATAWLKTQSIPVAAVGRNEPGRLDGLLAKARADLFCISTFPWLLPSRVTSMSRFGAINLHASLLPRHRGPNPYLWTYHAQDRETGVTVHEATPRADAGPIHLQAVHQLPRGYPVTRLHAELAELGARLMTDAVERLELGTARPWVQDESRATPAPRVASGSSLVRFEAWDVEEVWHFLAGMHPHFIEPLRGPDGRPALYAGVPSFKRLPSSAPGTVDFTNDGWALHCRGGMVRLTGEPESVGSRVGHQVL